MSIENVSINNQTNKQTIIKADAIIFSLSFKNMSCITAIQVSEADILTQATLKKKFSKLHLPEFPQWFNL